MTGTTVWDAAAVLAASAAWTWVPEGTTEVRTDRYWVLIRPSYLRVHPSVAVLDPDVDPDAVVGEVVAAMAERGEHRLSWQVSDESRPAGLEDVLLARGGRVDLRLDVLGLPLADGLPALEVPDDVTVREVTDEATMRDSYAVSGDAFGDDPPGDDQIRWALRELHEGQPEGRVRRVVAYLDGRPAGTGGVTLAGSVARLWGGSTHTDLRGRGAYRAVLLERMRWARGLGATLALTHGSVETSSPILRANGFQRYGEKREVVLDTSG